MPTGRTSDSGESDTEMGWRWRAPGSIQRPTILGGMTDGPHNFLPAPAQAQSPASRGTGGLARNRLSGDTDEGAVPDLRAPLRFAEVFRTATVRP